MHRRIHAVEPSLRARASRFMSAGLVTALVAVAALVALAGTARAATDGAGGEEAAVLRLSLDEAVARAVARGAEVRLARRNVDAAAAHRVGAGLVMPVNPRLSLDARPPVTGGGSIPADLGYGAVLDFLFEVGGAPAARVREANRGADLARAELSLAELDARVGAWSAYLRARIADDRVAEVERAVGVAERVLDASQRRAAAGATGDIEESLAASELGERRAELEDAQRNRDALRMQLRDALDVDATQRLALTSAVTEPEPAPESPALVARALARRPELAVIDRRVKLLDATDQRLAREAFPRTGLYLGVDAAPLSPVFGIVGVSVELPIVQRNQGPRAVVAAQRSGENDRLELEARRVAREVVAAKEGYEARRAELRRLTTDALPAAERTYELVETGWRSGRFDVFRVTNAARDVARIRSLRLDALEAAWLERIALDRATGGGGRS